MNFIINYTGDLFSVFSISLGFHGVCYGISDESLKCKMV